MNRERELRTQNLELRTGKEMTAWQIKLLKGGKVLNIFES